MNRRLRQIVGVAPFSVVGPRVRVAGAEPAGGPAAAAFSGGPSFLLSDARPERTLFVPVRRDRPARRRRRPPRPRPGPPLSRVTVRGTPGRLAYSSRVKLHWRHTEPLKGPSHWQWGYIPARDCSTCLHAGVARIRAGAIASPRFLLPFLGPPRRQARESR